MLNNTVSNRMRFLSMYVRVDDVSIAEKEPWRPLVNLASKYSFSAHFPAWSLGASTEHLFGIFCSLLI